MNFNHQVSCAKCNTIDKNKAMVVQNNSVLCEDCIFEQVINEKFQERMRGSSNLIKRP